MSEGPDIAVVLDASALIAYLNREPGREEVEARLPDALLSTVNLAEVIARLVERGHADSAIMGDVAALGVTVVPFTAEHALAAAKLRPLTRSLGLGLGDRACLALGLERGATVLTADRAWAGLDSSYRVEVLR